MCESQGISGNCCCCPPAQLFQEKICGNFGPNNTVVVWSAGEVDDYVQGTFEVFNSASSTENVGIAVTGVQGSFTAETPPGFSRAISARFPITFQIGSLSNTSGTFCITLYKRIRA
ncbi:S-Ena type endospore appendage [Bacillus sp. F9_6S_D1_P_5]